MIFGRNATIRFSLKSNDDNSFDISYRKDVPGKKYNINELMKIRKSYDTQHKGPLFLSTIPREKLVFADNVT